MDSQQTISTWQQAEQAAAEHMIEIGFDEVRLTRGGADGGLDVTADNAAAQVKFQVVPVGAPEVQRLKGAAFAMQHLLFYSASEYSSSAVAYADSAGIALFKFEPFGVIEPVNALSRSLIETTPEGSEDARRRQDLHVLMAWVAIEHDRIVNQEYMSMLTTEQLRSIANDGDRITRAEETIRAARIEVTRAWERTSTPRLFELTSAGFSALLEIADMFEATLQNLEAIGELLGRNASAESSEAGHAG